MRNTQRITSSRPSDKKWAYRRVAQNGIWDRSFLVAKGRSILRRQGGSIEMHSKRRSMFLNFPRPDNRQWPIT
jgi:hypothetical protein